LAGACRPAGESPLILSKSRTAVNESAAKEKGKPVSRESLSNNDLSENCCSNADPAIPWRPTIDPRCSPELSPLLGITTVPVITAVPRPFRQALAFAIRAPESVADRETEQSSDANEPRTISIPEAHEVAGSKSAFW
jgi:hypothetical protein